MSFAAMLFLQHEVAHEERVDAGRVEAAYRVARGADERLAEEVEGRIVEDGQPRRLARGMQQLPVQRVVFAIDRVDAYQVARQRRGCEAFAIRRPDSAHGRKEARVSAGLEILGAQLRRNRRRELAEL